MTGATYKVTHPAGAPRPAVPVENAVHDGVGARVSAREQPHGLLDGRVQALQRFFVDPVPGEQRRWVFKPKSIHGVRIFWELLRKSA